jgi:hypothetical protein
MLFLLLSFFPVNYVFTSVFRIHVCNFYSNIVINTLQYKYLLTSISMMQRFILHVHKGLIKMPCSRDDDFEILEGKYLELQHYGVMPIDNELAYCMCCHLSLQRYIRNNSTIFVLFLGKLLRILNKFIQAMNSSLRAMRHLFVWNA